MAGAADLQELGLTVGRVVAVREHAGARAPSFLLTIDLGPQGRYECGMAHSEYTPADLEGRQVVCARDGDEVVIVSAHSHARGVVLIGPDRDVENGSIVA